MREYTEKQLARKEKEIARWIDKNETRASIAKEELRIMKEGKELPSWTVHFTSFEDELEALRKI